jgi:hypothetical protein
MYLLSLIHPEKHSARIPSAWPDASSTMSFKHQFAVTCNNLGTLAITLVPYAQSDSGFIFLDNADGIDYGTAALSYRGGTVQKPIGQNKNNIFQGHTMAATYRIVSASISFTCT